MGMFGSSSKDAKRGAKKSARYLMEGTREAQGYQNPAYDAAIGRIDPTTAATRDWLTQGKNAVTDAYGNAYNTATGAVNTGLTQSLGSIQGGYNTARGDVAGSLAGQLSAIENARATGTGYYQPYMTAGQGGLDRITQMTTPGQQFTAMQADPGYQWRLSQGLEGVTNSAGATGGVFGGNTLKALNDYAQNQASGEFGNVYNRNFNLAQLGLNASQGAAGLSQWAGGASAGANQWAGNQNLGLAQWLGAGQADLQTGAASNLANLATGYGNNMAGTLGQYYGANANLTGQAADQRNQLSLAQAQMQADYAMQRANAQAARETAQANAGSGNSWMGPALGAVGTAAGGIIGSYFPVVGTAAGASIGGAIGSGVGSAMGGGGGQQAQMQMPQGYAYGGYTGYAPAGSGGGGNTYGSSNFGSLGPSWNQYANGNGSSTGYGQLGYSNRIY